MAWIQLQESDLLERLSGPELAAFRAAALGSGQADPIGGVIDQTVNVVRGYVAGCLRNRLGQAGTIPDKLKQAALSLIVMDVMSRAAGRVLDPQGQRKTAAAAATRLLEQVAACHFAVDLPTTFDAETIAIGTPTFNDNGRHRHFRRDKQVGI